MTGVNWRGAAKTGGPAGIGGSLARAWQQRRRFDGGTQIDRIDRVLAQHYGFKDEELDFIINYDIKYRMGGAESPDDGE